MSKKEEFQGLKVEVEATGNREISQDILRTTIDLIDLMKTDKVKIHVVAEELKE